MADQRHYEALKENTILISRSTNLVDKSGSLKECSSSRDVDD